MNINVKLRHLDYPHSVRSDHVTPQWVKQPKSDDYKFRKKKRKAEDGGKVC